MALAGVLMVLISVLGSAFAPNMEVFLVLRVLGGLGGGTIPPTSVGMVSDVISPARRAQAVGGIMRTVVLTSAIAVPLVALFADLWGWRSTFVLASLLLAVASSLELVLGIPETAGNAVATSCSSPGIAPCFP